MEDKELFVNGEFIRGNIGNRNRIENLPDFPDLYHKADYTCYTSVYRFDCGIIEHVNKTGSVSGYRGTCRATGLHFDFDSPHDDLSLIELRKFIEKLCRTPDYSTYIDDLKIYFSGNKGFHLIIENTETRTMTPAAGIPEQVKKVCIALAGEFSSFDRSVYDTTRIFRVINSKHQKTGLYKIPVYAGEVFCLSFLDIKELATRQRDLRELTTIRQFRAGRENNGIA